MSWDLTSYFTEFNGPEMLHFKEALKQDIARVREQANALPPVTPHSARDWELVLLKHEDILYLA